MSSEKYNVSRIRAVLLLFFRAPAFVRICKEHDKALPSVTKPQDQQEEATHQLRRALGHGLILVLISGLAGAVGGYVLSHAIGKPIAAWLVGLQLMAGLILLWATLTYLGWEIQTWKGQTLAEKVNRWIFRGNYCLGTALLVTSLTWPL